MRKLQSASLALFALIVAANCEAATANCSDNSTALGVSRVAVVDTSGGPNFGHLQYRDHDFLKPGEVVLTFDDGPLRRHTRQVLEALSAHCTKATFFLVGRMAVSDPAMVKEIAAKGHTIGSHTWSHRNIRAQSAGSAEKEIELGISAIQKALGKPIAPFFRFPYLADSQTSLAALKVRNFASFSIDVDSRDYRTQSGDQIRRNVMSQLASRGKGIMLFHDIQTSTARGLKAVLDELKAKKYRIVHIVPKVPAVTIARYDEAADKIMAGKPSGIQVADTGINRPGIVAPVKPVYSVAQPRPTIPASAPAVAVVQPAPRVRSEGDWRLRVFNQD